MIKAIGVGIIWEAFEKDFPESKLRNDRIRWNAYRKGWEAAKAGDAGIYYDNEVMQVRRISWPFPKE